MGIFSGLFKSRDKPQNRTTGSNYAFFFGGTTSGKAVTERSAMQMTAVYSCVRILSEAVAGLPLHLYKYTDSGGKAMALDHPLYRLLHDEPNPEMSSFVFRETLMTHLLLWGNAYAQIIRNGKNEIVALYPLMPNKMSVDRDEDGRLYYTYYRGTDEAIKNKEFAVTLQPSDVLHIPGLGFDGLVGYSPIAMAKNAIGMATVESILQNEKYKGAALLQKCFTVDFLTKKRKANEGEVPQYYVEHSHEPIITPEEFDKVQTELARRKQISRQYSGKSIFSSRIVCGDCGSYFGSKVWNSTSKYRRVIWQCNGKFKGEHKCETPHLDEETIKVRFVTALNAIIESKDNILEDCRLMQATLTDCTGIDAEIESLLEEIDVVTELTKRCIAENSQTAQNQEEYAARYNGFVERYEKAKAQLEQLRATKAAREAQAEAIGAFMFEVQELDALTEFDEKLWLTIIDTITIHADRRMTFKFQGGTEIEV